MKTLSPVASLLRRHDRDRYLTALFAPGERREALMALYAFNYEVARTRELVTEPVLGQIRLQWWRESLDAAYGGGLVRRHEVVEPLTHAIRAYQLSREHFDRLLEARAFDLEDAPPLTLAALEAYCEATSSRLLWLALEVLGVRDDGAAASAAREIGIAYATIGLLRAIPFHARARRQYIPTALAAETGLDPESLFALKPTPALAKAVQVLAEDAHRRLAAARGHARTAAKGAMPALLPGRIAERALGRIARARYDVFDPGLAAPRPLQSLGLAWTALSGRY
ncbi:MAG TPA: phytoene/squalene synthase family protein [Stellaceae bacterium]|nr:phytoene/squalene synthase family protein [Stellaceae bacterium]